MPNRLVRLARSSMQRGPFALPVLALLAVYTLVLYRRALAVGVLSDGWVLLEIGSRGFRKAPFVLLSYHTIPVTNLFMAALWKLFGLADRWYQVVNLGELALVGWLLYLLGCALFRQPRVALLASLLFLANSSFYEVPFWPTVGNFQSLAALLYLLGIFAVDRAFRSPRPWPRLLVFSLSGLAAFFTYEPAVSMLGVGMIYAAVVPARDGEPLSWGPQARRVLAVLGTALPVIAIVLGSKLYTSSQGYQAAFLPHDWNLLKFRIYLLVRGLIGIFSLRGADYKLYEILTFGLVPPVGRLRSVLIAAWALGLAAGGTLFVWRTRSPAARFVTLWLAVHMLTVAAATDIVSRHFYLGALPASLLVAWLMWSAADRAAAWLGRREAFSSLRMTEAQVATLLVFCVLILMISEAATDLNTAATLHREATQATRQVAALVQQRLAQDPTATPRVALVNMPAIVAQDGVGAFAFVNGLHPLLQLSTQGRVTNPELFYTYAQFADGKFANASRPISLGELARRVSDPASLVLMFDGRTRTVKELSPATWRLPERYDLDSAPFLEWQSGAWPWFRVYAGQPLELPLRPGPSWVAIRYLRSPGVAFTVASSARPPVTVRSPREGQPSWPIVALPVDGDLTLQPETEVWLAGVWSFSPPEDYSQETAPFLPWIARPFPQFIVEGPTVLPVSTTRCASRPCMVRIEYLAERGRVFSLALEGGPRRSFTFDGLTAPEWRSETLAISPSKAAEVRIEPQGTAPVFLRRLAGEPQTGTPPP
ncbi:MAG: hypothetical protein ACJ76Y_25795 [Thermoanaerobaculia bacterium]